MRWWVVHPVTGDAVQAASLTDALGTSSRLASDTQRDVTVWCVEGGEQVGEITRSPYRGGVATRWEGRTGQGASP